MRTPFDLIQALRSWFFAKDAAINTGGLDINTGGGDVIVGAGSVDGIDIGAHDADGDAHHNESHTVASHSDTTGTGSELNTLTDGSDAGSLHIHDARYYQESEFSAYPSTEKPLKSSASGGLNLGQNLGVDGVILAGDDIKTAGGLVVGSSSASVPTGVIILAEVASVGTPSTGFAGLYFKTSDGLLYYKNDTGTEYKVATV